VGGPVPQGRKGVKLEPIPTRNVAKVAMTKLTDSPPAIESYPPAKFGGQPDWFEKPAWPLDGDGRPMTFYGQLPVVQTPRTMAYIFFCRSESAASWVPLGLGNAVILRPGADPGHVRTEHRTEGPRLFTRQPERRGYRRRSFARPYEAFPVLSPGMDPSEWIFPHVPEGQHIEDRHTDWNKIGGTPMFLQAEEYPEGESWRFAFQFTADWAAQELGDGAECYGFIDGSGHAAILWQCH